MNSNQPKQLTQAIDSAEFKALFKTKPFIHAMAMLYNWLIILLVILLFQYFSNWWWYPVAVLVIGARMHALAVLMHDATHYRFLKNRKWNDLISNLLIMYPIYTSIEEYRANHLKHHQHLNSENDPDWVAKLSKREFQFPKTKTAFILTLSSYLVLYQGIMDAIWFVKRYKGSDSSKPSTKSENPLLKISFYVLLFSLLTVFGVWKSYLLFWVVPYLSAFFMFQYIRSVAEHYGEMAYENDLSSTRTVIPNFLERFLIAPHAVGYHLEHHLYPGVPFYHLPKLHRMLIQQEEYKADAHITKGYVTGLMQELGKV